MEAVPGPFGPIGLPELILIGLVAAGIVGGVVALVIAESRNERQDS